ncbi:DUF1990 domain-containing protein [Streptomyces tanashiensis]|uniref:DUF1990 family protein n=1 Tax=Streptomyces tanashiensis TaxID=67367 RepID=UPI0016718DE2|nr:DUF1990 domain-containing protein [Streptomyces tanashiensis]GGT00831.1 DUF1990 domain-containing protein [Streptomyces tanashiensis]
MTRLTQSLSRPALPRPSLTYREVGATRTPEELPADYHHLRHSTVVGRGRAAFETAGAAVTTWRMHRASGARVHSDAERAWPGVRLEVALGAGPLRLGVPCAVIWTAYEKDRVGFAYGTLSGHAECGEESFVVELEPDGTVRFTVTAFSRPAAWYTRLAGPLVPRLQHAYARRLGRTLARLVRT